MRGDSGQVAVSCSEGAQRLQCSGLKPGTTVLMPCWWQYVQTENNGLSDLPSGKKSQEGICSLRSGN